MSTFAWIGCAIACGIVWVVKEIVGEIVGGLVAETLRWMFAPLRRALVAPVYRALLMRLAGPAGGTWQAALTATFVVTALAGGTLVGMVAPRPWFAVGAFGTVLGLGALLVLDSARNEVKRARVSVTDRR
jgi:hypothetical protein